MLKGGPALARIQLSVMQSQLLPMLNEAAIAEKEAIMPRNRKMIFILMFVVWSG